LVERQQSFLELEDEGAERALPAKPKPARRRRQDSAAPIEVVEALRAETAKLGERLAGIEKLLDELRAAHVSASPAKAYCTTVEAAKLLGKRPYTVREWRRLGRVRGEQAAFGRGLDEEWRISHDELARVQNEGMLRVKRETRVTAPARVWATRWHCKRL
jgi:hypothetical protein